MSCCYKNEDERKWAYEKIDDEKLFRMYKARYKKQDVKRPSTFLREHNLT